MSKRRAISGSVTLLLILLRRGGRLTGEEERFERG